MVCAILSREDELLKMPMSKTAMLFACLSRFISLIDQGQDEPTEASLRFDQYKESFAANLSVSYELKIDDVFTLATPLAAEQIQSPKMWQTFARIAVQKEHEVEQREYFKNYANLSWAMSKVSYEGQEFWQFIERLYMTELEKTKLKDQPRELTASVLATMCFALKDCQPHNFTDDFWHELN